MNRQMTQTPSGHTVAPVDHRPRGWPLWARGSWLVLGAALSVVVGYLAALMVIVTAVLLDAAPLGLAGEQQVAEPWVSPTAATVAVAVFGLGLWRTVRTVRRHSARESSEA